MIRGRKKKLFLKWKNLSLQIKQPVMTTILPHSLAADAVADKLTPAEGNDPPTLEEAQEYVRRLQAIAMDQAQRRETEKLGSTKGVPPDSFTSQEKTPFTFTQEESKKPNFTRSQSEGTKKTKTQSKKTPRTPPIRKSL